MNGIKERISLETFVNKVWDNLKNKENNTKDIASKFIFNDKDNFYMYIKKIYKKLNDLYKFDDYFDKLFPVINYNQNLFLKTNKIILNILRNLDIEKKMNIKDKINEEEKINKKYIEGILNDEDLNKEKIELIKFFNNKEDILMKDYYSILKSFINKLPPLVNSNIKKSFKYIRTIEDILKQVENKGAEKIYFNYGMNILKKHPNQFNEYSNTILKIINLSNIDWYGYKFDKYYDLIEKYSKYSVDMIHKNGIDLFKKFNRNIIRFGKRYDKSMLDYIRCSKIFYEKHIDLLDLFTKTAIKITNPHYSSNEQLTYMVNISDILTDDSVKNNKKVFINVTKEVNRFLNLKHNKKAYIFSLFFRSLSNLGYESFLGKHYQKTGFKILNKSDIASANFFMIDPNEKLYNEKKLIDRLYKQKGNFKYFNTNVKKTFLIDSGIRKKSYEKIYILLNFLKGLKHNKIEKLSYNEFNKKFIAEIININYSSLKDKNQFPAINELIKNQYILTSSLRGLKYEEEVKNGKLMFDIFEELKKFYKNKLTDSSFLEIEKLSDSYGFAKYIDKIRIEFNDHGLEDYLNNLVFRISYKDKYHMINDCLSYQGKYEDEGVNFILNPYSCFLNINRIGFNLKENLGRAIITKAKINNEDVFYVAGFSGGVMLSKIPNWEKYVYEGIVKLGKINKTGIFFDLNPRNTSKYSHEFAYHCAQNVSLKENLDYTYNETKLATKEFKSNRKEILFKLIKPKWHEIEVKISRHIKGNLFLESIMPAPENKYDKEVYFINRDNNKGYVSGYLVDYKNL